MTVVVRRASDRFRTRTSDRETWHAFSFGPHYDPANTGHGPLVLHDEHLLAPGAGFALHRHAGVEVVTWVLTGTLVHEDSTGRSGTVRAGRVQVLSAGTGVEHRERNAGDDELRFVQAWLAGDDGPPRHELADVALPDGVLVPVASGLTAAAVRLRTPATLHVARLGAGRTVLLPDAGLLHVAVLRGAVDLDDTRLDVGDTARTTAAGPLPVAAVGPAELLVWELAHS